MKILNSPMTYIKTYDPNNPVIEDIPQSAAIPLVSHLDYEAWYIQFSCEHSFRVYDINKIVPSDVIARIKAGEVFLLLDNALEPFYKSADGIYENLVVTAGIPERQIMFMTGIPDMVDYVNSLAEKFNKKPIRVLWFNLFEWTLKSALEVQYRDEGPMKTLQAKPYQKKFLSLNRRWRLHRPLLMTLLYNKNLIDKGFISFGRCDANDNWDYKWRELTHYYRNNPLMLEIFKASEGVKNLPPMYLDTTNLRKNRAHPSRDTDQFYLDSYFSVVSETTYHTSEHYANARFLSEKIFKAIAMCHPFIIVSVPNSLDVLKKLGYKTFSPLINEQYDQEPNDGKRALMIVNEIERLCNLSEKDLDHFLVAAREICLYNYKVLSSKNIFVQEMN